MKEFGCGLVFKGADGSIVCGEGPVEKEVVAGETERRASSGLLPLGARDGSEGVPRCCCLDELFALGELGG